MGFRNQPVPAAAAAGGVLPGAFLTFPDVDGSADISSSLITVTDAASSAPYTVSVNTPARQLWLVTFTCKRWHWYSTAFERPTNPTVFLKPTGTAAPTPDDYRWESPNVSAAGASVQQFDGFSLVGLFRAATAGVATFTVKAINVGGGVSAFDLEGPILLSATDAGPN